MGYAHQYAEAVLNRARVDMEPVDFTPDWADKPRRQKVYPDAVRVPLPPGAYPDDGLLQTAVETAATATPGDGEDAFDLDRLGGMLLDSYGLTGRRMGVQANTDLPALPLYADANWCRGTASGGGLYPVSIYWVAGGSAPVVPGVYHYSPSHHALEQLLTGDVSRVVAEAVADEELTRHCDQFLVLGVKYWQNAYKYNSFSFHVVTMDVGTVLQSWRLWAGARGLRVEPVLWFDERRVADLLGVDTDDEGVFAVVPLRWVGGPHTRGEGGVRTSPGRPVLGAAAPGPGPTVRLCEDERSRRPFAFDAVRDMQRATLAAPGARPPRDALTRVARRLPGRSARGSQDRVHLPAPARLDVPVRTALRTRRSSFGRFSGQRPTAPADLAAVLAAAASAPLPCEVTRATGDLVSLYVFVNHVEGLAQGAYHYEPVSRSLELLLEGPQGGFLQQSYFLSNYNLEQAGAVIVPAAPTPAVLDAVGERGYRLVNAVVGALSQTVYTACAALGLGCGAALGFDNVSYVEQLGLEETGELPLLILMIGHERPRSGDYQYALA